jgi:Protein of unknown function (DUF4240)
MDAMPRARTSLALAALAIMALAGAYGLGSRRAATETTVTARETAAAPATTEATVAPQTTAAAPSAEVMDEAAFWRLVTDTRAAADDDTGRQSELLDARLRRLPAEQIAAFERIRHALDLRAYTWDVWAAAYVIEDGCSDDCFRDFRGYLISLGRGPYDTALRDPDALAPTVQDAETGNWENADDVAPDAYQSVTGEDIPGDSSDLSGDPRGTPLDDDHAEALVQRYPRLAARFR